MAIFQNNLLAGAGAQSSDSTHTIDQSIRFNDNDSPFMSRTQQSGTQTTWTISCWVKIGNMPGDFTIWSVHTGYQSFAQIRSSTGLEFAVGNGSSSASLHDITRLFRDPSAWYHLVMVFDSTNAISSERARIYVNGQRETSFSTLGSWAKDYASNVGSTQTMYIGEQGTGGNHMDGYIAEFVQIDGQALEPSSFGEYNSSGIWVPKNVSGLTFGTNGCYIKGETASDLGNDSSGNNNDFTTSGLVASDQVLDSPTNNFAVYNILYNVGDVDFPTYSEGNLSVDFNYFGKRSPVSTFALPTDSDAYCEFYIKTSASSTHNSGVGIGQGDANNAGNVALTNGITYNFNGYKMIGGTATPFGNTYTAGDIIGVYFDLSDNEVDFYKNNTLEGSISLSTLSGDLFFLVANNATDQQVIIANFGQDDTFAGNKTSGSAGASDSSGNGKFYYTRISGAKALCSKSLGS